MAVSNIPVDLLNPGQVFACLGLLEIANELFGRAQGMYDWEDGDDTRFQVSTEGQECPVRSVIQFLRTASVMARSPSKAALNAEGWNVPTEEIKISKGDPFPFSEPDSPATLPTVLWTSEHSIEINHWGDNFGDSGRDNVKFWAGAGGYPGAALARDALALIKELPIDAEVDPLNASARQSSSFRFDWRRDYVPLDIGFSLNAHSQDRFCTVGYPIVEILAAVGLSQARPKFVNKLEYRYGVVSVQGLPLDPVFHRAGLGAVQLPFQQRLFKMNLGWPGKEGQARCITTVQEIFSPE